MRERGGRRVNSLDTLKRVRLKNYYGFVESRLGGSNVCVEVVYLPGGIDVVFKQAERELHIRVAVLAHGAVHARSCRVEHVWVPNGLSIGIQRTHIFKGLQVWCGFFGGADIVDEQVDNGLRDPTVLASSN